MLIFYQDPQYRDEVSGCTASVALISKSNIYVVSSRVHDTQYSLIAELLEGNAGDSRSVLGVKGRAKPLSYDHKPSNDGQ